MRTKTCSSYISNLNGERGWRRAAASVSVGISLLSYLGPWTDFTSVGGEKIRRRMNLRVPACGTETEESDFMKNSSTKGYDHVDS